MIFNTLIKCTFNVKLKVQLETILNPYILIFCHALKKNTYFDNMLTHKAHVMYLIIISTVVCYSLLHLKLIY